MTETLQNYKPISLRSDALQHQLSKHKLYEYINTQAALKIFMEHHVFAVWDFMSLIKSLQQHIAPSKLPWVPPKNPRHANFINQLVLEEESDNALTDSFGDTHASHFESYVHAMAEIDANTQPITNFIDIVKTKGLKAAFKLPDVPTPAKTFMSFTFDIIERNEPYLLAAVLAHGRENLVPHLFQCLENGLQIDRRETPSLYAYLEHHILLDGEEHGPLATQLLEELCEGSIQKRIAAMEIAEQTLEVRLKFWDEIQRALLH